MQNTHDFRQLFKHRFIYLFQGYYVYYILQATSHSLHISCFNLGGLLQTDTDSLKRMVLGDLLELGLQKHSDEVKAIVQRAVKGLLK